MPSTYTGLYSRAAAAAARAMSAGVRGIEIEFPPTPSLNRAGDGSRRAEAAERVSNARLAASIAQKLHSKQPVLLVFDDKMFRAVEDELKLANINADIQLWSTTNHFDSQHLFSKNADESIDSPLIAVSPGALEEWTFLERAAQPGLRTVLVANGMFHNGMDWLEPAFYVKPCSGWGILLKEFPHEYVAVSARTGAVLDGLQIEVLSQGRIRRPDLNKVSNALQRDYFS